MTSILNGLQIAQRALYAQQFGLEISQKNTANINTEGYSRERVNFQPGDADGSTGAGISGISVESFRDRFIDCSISRELQGQGEQESISAALQQIEAILNQSGSQGLQSALNSFFNSFSTLATSPEDPTLRQQVLEQGTALTEEFHHLYSKIQDIQSQQDSLVRDTVKEINSITADIASLNAQVSTARNTHSNDLSVLEDKRQQLMDKLSGIVDLSYFETDAGSFTVMSKQGILLVVGGQNCPLESALSSDGSYQRVMSNGEDVTSKIKSGTLGGLIGVRDTTITGYLETLDDLAATVIARVNNQHAQGSDYNGNQGGDFFIPFTQSTPGSNLGAARAITLAVSDPDQIAAASLGGGPGSNANANLLAGIKDEKLFSSSQSISDYFAGLIYQVGNDSKNADNSLATQKEVLTQLENQRDSFSGVSMDDEAISIIQYQKAYQASSRYVQVIDALSQELLNLIGG
jgi:flagellar hook-associated protein 1 FlgK